MSEIISFCLFYPINHEKIEKVFYIINLQNLSESTTTLGDGVAIMKHKSDPLILTSF